MSGADYIDLDAAKEAEPVVPRPMRNRSSRPLMRVQWD